MTAQAAEEMIKAEEAARAEPQVSETEEGKELEE